MDVRPAGCHHSPVHYSLFALVTAAVMGVLMLTVGILQYRRGDRWLVLTVLTLPTGVVLGIYADHHHHRALGLPAFILIMAYPVFNQIARYRSREKA